MEAFLVFLIFFSPLIYAGNSILPLTVIEASAFLFLSLILVRQSASGRISLVKIPLTPLILFLSLIFLQLASLPKELLSFLSPQTLRLYETFRPKAHCLFTLSIYPEHTVEQLLQLLSYLAIFAAAINCVDTEQKARRVVRAAVAAGFFYSLYGIISKLSAPLLSFSTFSNRDHFAAYIGMIIPLCICAALTEELKARKIIYIFAASVMGLALLLALSRAGMISFLFGIILFLLLLKKKRPLRKGLNLVMVFALSLALLLAIAGAGTLAQRLETLKEPLKAMEGRIGLIRDIPRLAADFPFFGTGLGTFGDIFQKYKSFAMSGFYGFSHNEPLQLLTETGMIGFLLVSVFFALYFKNIVLVWLRRRGRFAVVMSLGCIVGIFSIGLHSLFDFVFHIPANAVLFFIILALALRFIYFKEPQGSLPLPRWEFQLSFPSKVFIIVPVCLSLVFAWAFIFVRFNAVSAFERVKDRSIVSSGAEAVLEYKKTIKIIDSSISLNPRNSEFFSRKADLLSQAATREDTKADLIYLNKFTMPEEALREAGLLYNKAICLNPANAGYHIKSGWLYGLLGDKELMSEEFKRATILDPQNRKIREYIEKYAPGN